MVMWSGNLPVQIVDPKCTLSGPKWTLSVPYVPAKLSVQIVDPQVARPHSGLTFVMIRQWQLAAHHWRLLGPYSSPFVTSCYEPTGRTERYSWCRELRRHIAARRS